MQKLEEMVTSLMNTAQGRSESRSDPTSSTLYHQRLDDISDNRHNETLDSSSIGRLNIVGSEANYVGASHWEAILDNVSSLHRSRRCRLGR